MAFDRENPPSITPVVGFLLATNIIVYLLQTRTDTPIYQLFGLWPLHDTGTRPPFQLWQLLTYGWLHGSGAHIFFNLFAVWMFGKTIEMVWGSWRFLTYFLVCVVGAGLVQLVVTTQMAASTGQVVGTIGASGGVFGILLAFAVLFPNQKILLLIPPIPIKAKFFVIGYGAIELYLGITQTNSGVAHFAHLGGMVFGFILIRYWVFNRKRKLKREADPLD